MNVLKLIAQNGVHHKVFEGTGNHNAMWDMNISPEGKPYFSLGSELVNSNFARLYEYDLEKDEFIHLLNVEDVILHSKRAIRPSKIHTSINFMPNGNILFATHTTDRAPSHPYWIPEAYYGDPWEGYQGSNVMEYDPKTKKAFSHGIPVPYESIYGALYIERTNTLYFLGFFKGHLYSYSLDTKEVKDFGQVAEYGVFRLHEGPDGKIYFAGRSGYLMRFCIETEEVEVIGCRFNMTDKLIARLDYALNLDDTRIILFPVIDDYAYIFDTANDTLENIGSWGIEKLPDNPDANRSGVFGAALDSKNVLWYTSNTFLPVDNHFACLFRWDFLNGGEPENLGTIGSIKTGRICASVSEAYIRDDVLYIADTNHGEDLPGFITINLKEFEPHRYENAGYSTDLYIGAKAEKYKAFDEYNANMAKFNAENPFYIQNKNTEIYRLWLTLGLKNSKIKTINLTDKGACGYCGEKEDFFYNIEDGKIEAKPIANVNEKDLKKLRIKTTELVGEHIKTLAIYGRQYKSIVTASARLGDNRFIVGTQDGVIGIVDRGKVFRMGRVCTSGAVIDIVSTPDGSVVYGICGDVDGLGTVFKYTDDFGLEELGTLFFNKGSEYGFGNSTKPSCLDVSDDGKTLAIGVEDEMACVYILHF